MLAVCKRDIPGYKKGQKIQAVDTGSCVLIHTIFDYVKMEREDFYRNFEEVTND